MVTEEDLVDLGDIFNSDLWCPREHDEELVLGGAVEEYLLTNLVEHGTDRSSRTVERRSGSATRGLA